MPSRAQTSDDVATEELLVGFTPGAGRGRKTDVHRRNGGEIRRRFDAIDVDVVRVPPGRTLSEAMRSYRADRAVRFAEPNYMRTKAAVTPNDPSFPQQWALRNVGQQVVGQTGTPLADIGAAGPTTGPGAWDVTTGADSTIVAVVDTGVDLTHPDLAPNIWRNPAEVAGNGIDDDRNGYVDDVNGWDFAANDATVHDPADRCATAGPNDEHGTHVAGIVGAAGNNGRGVAGVAWRVRVMPLKFLTGCGQGSDADAIEAILYATRMGAQVVNASWGGPGRSEAVRQALLAARDAGIVVAVAAGNSGQDLAVQADYPASFGLQNEIVVAASDQNDLRASFSNYGGPTALAAPGRNILSTLPGNTYGVFSGTSMATPLVSGSLALLRSRFPRASISELRARLVQSVDRKAAFAGPVTTSGGRLNVNAALRQALPVPPTIRSPNGGDVLVPGIPATVTWDTNVQPGDPVPAYRVEHTSNALRTKTLESSFEAGTPDWLTQPSDSDAAWRLAPTAAPDGTTALRSGLGRADNDRASWASASLELPAPGRVSFSYRVSSESCESAQQAVCGDYLVFLVDGVEVLRKAGSTPWTTVSLPLGAGRHRLSWAYQKDWVCPEPASVSYCGATQSLEDAAWIDKLSVEGVDDASWSLAGTAPAGSSSYVWTVPDVSTQAGKVRVCADTGKLCQTEAADASDATFVVAPRVVPTTAPGAPTGVTAAAGNGQATVGWTAPASDGGSAVTGYTVTASPGGATATVGGSSTSATVTGLANGTAYTFSVVATNSVGSGPAGVSNSVTPLAPMPLVPSRSGYWMVGRTGDVYAFGDARSLGNAPVGGTPAVDLEPTPSGNGYWIVDEVGHVFTFGDAGYRGGLNGQGLAPGEKVTSLSSTGPGQGYWIFTSRGRVVPFGDAGFFGDMSGRTLNGPVLDSIPTPSGNGYFMVASDGGIFAFGDAQFRGSMGGKQLNAPVQSLVPEPDGDGYWLVASDGGIFAFAAGFHGSMGGHRLNKPITGMVAYGNGYLMVAEDGGIFSFSDKPFGGSLGGNPPANPIVSVAALG